MIAETVAAHRPAMEPNGFADSSPDLLSLAALVQAVREIQIELGEEIVVVGSATEARLASDLARVAGAISSARLEASDVERWPARSADVLLFACDDGLILSESLKLVRDRGRVLLLMPKLGAFDLDIYPDLHRRSLRVLCPAPSIPSPQIIEFARKLTASGRLHPTDR